MLLVLVCAQAVACSRERFAATLRTGDTVRVVRALKGHELHVQKQDALAKVRLVGISTFDARLRDEREIMAYGRLAIERIMARTGEAVPRVILERDAPDPRGRFLAYLELEGVDLGRLLVEEGLAGVYTEFPFSREADYLAAEARAREAKRGIWGASAAGARVLALRTTWAATRLRAFGDRVQDPLLGGAP